MKKLQNPTTYFFQQAEKADNQYSQEIDSFVNQLIDKDQCQLCRHPYDTSVNVPRIMVHCGHTFCSPCLSQFFMNRRVRCPMCLKLVKHLDSLERLPINHTIFQHVVNKEAEVLKKQNKNPGIKDASKFLFGEFERVQKEAHRLENPQKFDPDTGLPFCVFHPDRVQHFYCESHMTSGCRVCIEIGHSKPDCIVVDLYTVDPRKIPQIMNPQRNRNPETEIVQEIDHIGSYGQQNGQNIMLGLDKDEAYLEDDDEDEDDQEDSEKQGRHSF